MIYVAQLRKKREAQRALAVELAPLVARLVEAGLPKTADLASDAVENIGWEMANQRKGDDALIAVCPDCGSYVEENDYCEDCQTTVKPIPAQNVEDDDE